MNGRKISKELEIRTLKTKIERNKKRFDAKLISVEVLREIQYPLICRLNELEKVVPNENNN